MNLFRKLTAICTLLGAAALPATLLGAENGIKVKVPFAFIAGTRMLPAGEYMVDSTLPNGIVEIRGAQGAILIAGSQEQSNEATPALIFEHKGDKVYLMSVQFENTALRTMPAHVLDSPIATALR